MALAMLLAALVAVLIGVLISRTLLGPLRALTRATQAMQRGHQGEQPPLPSGREDELGELLTAFGRMRDDVARNQRARRQLTADIAHDLNTPLFVLSGMLEGLSSGTFRPSPERFARLRRQAALMSQLVRDLYFLSLADAGELPLHRRDTNLADLVRDTVGGFAAVAATQGLTLSCTLPEAPLTAQVDGARIMQVLQNLLGNALRHTPAGGRITVTGADEGRGVVLSVRDTGVGIPPERLPYVLDRLYRADDARSGEGSGLGLAICQSIVRAHGGTIAVESTLGVGTSVRVSLPKETRQGNDNPQRVLGPPASGT